MPDRLSVLTTKIEYAVEGVPSVKYSKISNTSPGLIKIRKHFLVD